MVRTLSTSLVAAVLFAACGEGPDPGPRRPNVLVVVMDTARADRCSFLGYERPTTPYLDSLAGESIVFTQAWSPSSWSGPAHASLFTGLRPEHHRFLLGLAYYLGPEATTLAEILGAAGWRTGSFSNNPFFDPDFGLPQGFEEAPPIWESVVDGAPPAADRGHELAAAFIRRAEAEGRPWFAFVNDMEAHLPCRPPLDLPEGFGRPAAEPGELDRVRALNTTEALLYNMYAYAISPREFDLLNRLYDADLRDLDRRLARFLGGLAADGLLDETILVVTSDHGENLGHHELAEHRGSLHRTTLHVPLFIRYPGRVPAGRREEIVRLEDVFPTVLALAGLPVPEGLDGASLTEPLDGRIARAIQGRPPRDLLENLRRQAPRSDLARMDRSIRSVFDGRHHYIRHSDGAEELYDVPADPEETRNLLPEERAAADRLRALVEE